MSPKDDAEMRTAVVVTLVMLVPLMIWSGWSFSVLWSWFVAPVFGLPLLSIPQAIGLSMVADWFRRGVKTQSWDSPGDVYFMLLKSALIPPIFLAFGWVLKVVAF